MTHLTLTALQEIVGGRLQSVRDEVAPLGRVVTDSRLVEAGDVFWGLVGERFNGGRFVNEALMRGATGVVVQDCEVDPWAGRFCLQVDDSCEALWRLARWHRSRMQGNTIAVTGSVGKTTTREMIQAVLQTELTGTASPKNYNNHFGVPLSMLEMAPEHDYAVLELGASGLGEIARLADLCQPQFGVITRLGEAHLEGFGGTDEVAQAKVELLSALPETGCAVLNGDDARLRRLIDDCAAEIIWVGRDADCDLVATDIQSDAGQLRFRVAGDQYTVNVWGRHFLTSALVAVAIGRKMGLDAGQIAAGLANFRSPAMRCEVIKRDGLTIVNDTYNSSPSAMRAVLDLLREMPTVGRRIVVCGDMAELGHEAGAWHRIIGQEVVTRCGADILIACGDCAEETTFGAISAGMPAERAIACRLPEETLPQLDDVVLPGDTVLVKGARALAMERVVAALLTEPTRSLRRAA
jgi:UDP-N-acetylmuramoyl-tripeptide--D-alanyl-D-alanine ligase